MYNVFIWIGIRNAAFGLSHWLYAVEFWFFSLKLKTIVEDEQLYSHERFEVAVFWIGCLLNTCIPLLTCFTQLITNSSQIVFRNTVTGCVLGLTLISCIILTDGLLRIKKVVQRVIGISISTKTLAVHLSAFYLYLVSFSLFYT